MSATNFTTQLLIPNIIYILKTMSSKDTPMTAGQICEEITTLNYNTEQFGQSEQWKVSKITVRRALEILISQQESSGNSVLAHSLPSTFGGKVIVVSQKTQAQTRYRYYFEPLLSPADVSLIFGAITSNRYLTAAEKNFLISRQKTLSAFQEETLPSGTSDFAKKPAPSVSSHISPMPSNLLYHVNALHDAIEKQYKIQLYHGKFSLDENSHTVRFQAKTRKDPHILNPYALLWNGGSYYLLATEDTDETHHPKHFRVDRIYSVKPLPDAKTNVPVPRADIPKTLKNFFRKNPKTSQLEFNAAKYTATYPHMRIFENSKLLKCNIECTEPALSIFIDTFGGNMDFTNISRVERSHPSYGEAGAIYYSVNIRNVQYDNIFRFCLQYHADLKVLSPSELAEDIKTHLQESLKKYL